MSDTLLCGHSSRSMFANKLVHRAPHLLQHPATTLPFSVSASKGGKHNAYEVLNHKLGTGSRFPPVCLSQSPAANGATHAHAPSPSSVNAIKGNKANSAEPPQSAEATPKTQYIATLLLQCPDQKVCVAGPPQLPLFSPLKWLGLVAALLVGSDCGSLTAAVWVSMQCNRIRPVYRRVQQYFFPANLI